MPISEYLLYYTQQIFFHVTCLHSKNWKFQWKDLLLKIFRAIWKQYQMDFKKIIYSNIFRHGRCLNMYTVRRRVLWRWPHPLIVIQNNFYRISLITLLTDLILQQENSTLKTCRQRQKVKINFTPILNTLNTKFCEW
jgi:hypothetical protein